MNALFRILILLGLGGFLGSGLSVPVNAQPANPVAAPQAASEPSSTAVSNSFQGHARATDAAKLMTAQGLLHIWAIAPVTGLGARFDLVARTALDSAIGSAPVHCEIKARTVPAAQCVNAQEQDLGLTMIQQGYATVDRSAVYGSVFESAYVAAEAQAQVQKRGAWDVSASGAAGGRSSWLFGLAIALSLLMVGAFGTISFFIMRSFRNVIDAQNRSVDIYAREQKLRSKERGVVAVMLDSELKANKAKIDAYCVVYEEMLRGLRDTTRTPKYRKSGDIIQKQPALTRSVFDRNTDKLDMLSPNLSSALVHFYARIKSNPEYINLEPSTEIGQAIDTVEKLVANGRRLGERVERILASFAESGIVSDNPEE